MENLEWISHADNIKYGFENNQYKQLTTTLKNKNTEEIFTFRSQSEASKFLNRNHGYLHDCVKHNKKIYDTENNEYEIIEMKYNK